MKYLETNLINNKINSAYHNFFKDLAIPSCLNYNSNNMKGGKLNNYNYIDENQLLHESSFNNSIKKSLVSSNSNKKLTKSNSNKRKKNKKTLKSKKEKI